MFFFPASRTAPQTSEELKGVGGVHTGMCSLLLYHPELVDTVIVDVFCSHCDDPFKKQPFTSVLRRTPAASSQDPDTETLIKGDREKRRRNRIELVTAASSAITPDTTLTPCWIFCFADVVRCRFYLFPRSTFRVPNYTTSLPFLYYLMRWVFLKKYTYLFL